MIYKNIRWIIHKDNENYESLLLGSPSVGHAVRIAFIILYIIITVVVYRISSRYGGGYDGTANSFLFVGFLVGLFIMSLEDLLDFEIPSILLDGRTEKITSLSSTTRSASVREHDSRSTSDPGVFVVEQDNIGLWNTRKQRMQLCYLLYNETLQKLIQSKKIKGSSFVEWSKKRHKPHIWAANVSNITKSDIASSDVPWRTAAQHSIFLLTHTLTLAYIVGHWDIKIFKSIFIWVAAASSLSVSTLVWWNVQSYVDRKYVLYFIKKIQLISSGLALCAVLGFIGKTAFKK